MKTMQEKLGVKKAGQTELNAKSCAQRATIIRKLVEKNGLSGEKRRKLLSQAAWYAWKSNQFKKSRRA